MFAVRRLGPGGRDLILEMQEIVLRGLGNPDIFQTSTPEFIDYCLADGGLCYSVNADDQPVGYRMVYFPRDREFNLAKHARLSRTEYGRVAHWDTIAVLPAWRGRGLPRLLNDQAFDDIGRTSTRYLFATSSPLNPAGGRSLIATGFRPIRLVRMFGGKLRLLFYRPTPDAWPSPERSNADRIVALTDIEALAGAFDRGWIGTGIETEPSGPRLRMACQHLPFPTADGHRQTPAP